MSDADSIYIHFSTISINQRGDQSVNQKKKANFKSDCLLCQKKSDVGQFFGNKSFLLNGNAHSNVFVEP
jgi:hypothetical protein